MVNINQSDPWLKSIRLWITDECHHAVIKSTYEKVVKMLPNARGLGVTATPLRADGKGLGAHAHGLFHHMIIGPSMRDLIDRNRICDYRLFSPNNDVDLTNVPISSSGDFSRA
jgi:superfamily II DNA or RNA helicase